MDRSERKEREYNQRRAEILSCAEAVFAAKGFYKATVAEIADASGFAVGTLYQYFDSKEKLFADMLTEKVDLFYGGIRDAADDKKNSLVKIQAIVDSYFSFLKDNANFCTIFIQRESTVFAEGSPALKKRMVADYLAHIAFLETIMAEGAEAGLLKNINPRLMAAALAGMLKSYTFHWLMRRGNRPIAEISETLVDIFFSGVKTVDE